MPLTTISAVCFLIVGVALLDINSFDDDDHVGNICTGFLLAIGFLLAPWKEFGYWITGLAILVILLAPTVIKEVIKNRKDKKLPEKS